MQREYTDEELASVRGGASVGAVSSMFGSTGVLTAEMADSYEPRSNAKLHEQKRRKQPSMKRKAAEDKLRAVLAGLDD